MSLGVQVVNGVKNVTFVEKVDEGRYYQFAAKERSKRRRGYVNGLQCRYRSNQHHLRRQRRRTRHNRRCRYPELVPVHAPVV